MYDGTLQVCFMQDPQIPNFYFANLETHPISEDLTGP